MGKSVKTCHKCSPVKLGPQQKPSPSWPESTQGHPDIYIHEYIYIYIHIYINVIYAIHMYIYMVTRVPWNTTNVLHVHQQLPSKASTRNTHDMHHHHYGSSPGDLWKLLNFEVCSPTWYTCIHLCLFIHAYVIHNAYVRMHIHIYIYIYMCICKWYVYNTHI